MCSLYRLWVKVRRPLAADWILRNQRTFLMNGPFKGAEQGIWRQAVLSEQAVSGGGHAAAIMVDFRKYLDLIPHNALRLRAQRLGIDPGIINGALAMYAAPRLLRHGGRMHHSALYPTRGSTRRAGCPPDAGLPTS